MSARPDAVRELAVLLRAPEPGTNNLGAFVCEHAKALAPSLGVRESSLVSSSGVPDETLAPKLVTRLASLREGRCAYLDERRYSVGLEATERLAHTARFEDARAIVDADVLLGDLLALRDVRYVRFVQPDAFDVAIARRTLADCAWLTRLHLDLAAWLDVDGLHFRYKAGRAGFNWRPQSVDARDHALVHTVRLPTPAVAARVRRRAPSLLGDILQDLGWPA